MFAAMKEKLLGGAKKLSGRTDALEAVCAAAALVAAADGEIEDAEITATTKAISSNSALSAAFDARSIEKCADTMLQRASGGRVGKQALFTEIRQIGSDPVIAELVLLAALDVAESDGQIEPEEKAVLERIAKELGLSLGAYL